MNIQPKQAGPKRAGRAARIAGISSVVFVLAGVPAFACSPASMDPSCSLSPLNANNLWANNPNNPSNFFHVQNDNQPSQFNRLLLGALAAGEAAPVAEPQVADPEPAYPPEPRRHHRHHKRYRAAR